MNECGTIPGSYTWGYEQTCENRLPCGLCRLMMSMCPLGHSHYEVTCGPGSGVSTTVTSDPNSKITAWNSEAEHET